MSNKKIISFVALSAVLLTGCSNNEIAAFPSNYDDPIVETGDKTIYNNEMNVIIDKIRGVTSYNTNVQSKILEFIAEDKYAEIVDTVEFEALIQDRVNEKLFSQANSGNYTERGVFYEKKFAQTLIKDMYKVNGSYDLDQISEWHEVVITPDINADNVGEKLLHLDYYTEYIEKQIVPEIHQELLIEDYVIEQESRSLYLSKAREVNYVQIKINEKHPEAAKYLVDTFIDTNILAADATAEDANLEILANAWRGDVDQFIANEADLLVDAEVKGSGFDHTSYGDLMTEYNSITDNVSTTNATAESDFTGSGAYVKEIGLEIKTNTLKTVDYTTDGWHVQDGGLTALPAAIRERIFDRNTENGVSEVLDDDGDASNGGLDANGDHNSYIRNINGIYYLMPESVDGDNDRNFLHFDSGSSSYFIVQVNEAVSRNKFDPENLQSFYGDEKVAEISREIAQIIARRDTIKTRATEFYLEEIFESLEFFDQQIYDYFLGAFPDIFAED